MHGDDEGGNSRCVTRDGSGETLSRCRLCSHAYRFSLGPFCADADGTRGTRGHDISKLVESTWIVYGFAVLAPVLAWLGFNQLDISVKLIQASGVGLPRDGREHTEVSSHGMAWQPLGLSAPSTTLA